MEIITEVSVMPPKEEAAVTNTKLKPSSSGQQDVNLLCIEAPNDNKVNTSSFSTTCLLLVPPHQMVVPYLQMQGHFFVAYFDDILLY